MSPFWIVEMLKPRTSFAWISTILTPGCLIPKNVAVRHNCLPALCGYESSSDAKPSLKKHVLRRAAHEIASIMVFSKIVCSSQCGQSDSNRPLYIHLERCTDITKIASVCLWCTCPRTGLTDTWPMLTLFPSTKPTPGWKPSCTGIIAKYSRHQDLKRQLLWKSFRSLYANLSSKSQRGWWKFWSIKSYMRSPHPKVAVTIDRAFTTPPQGLPKIKIAWHIPHSKSLRKQGSY